MAFTLRAAEQQQAAQATLPGDYRERHTRVALADWGEADAKAWAAERAVSIKLMEFAGGDGEGPSAHMLRAAKRYRVRATELLHTAIARACLADKESSG